MIGRWAGRRLAGPSICGPAPEEEARRNDRRRDYAGSRYRGDGRGFQHRRGGAPAAAAIPGPRPAGGHLGPGPSGEGARKSICALHGLRRMEPAGPFFRKHRGGHVGIFAHACLDRTRTRQRAAGHSGECDVLRHSRGSCRAGPHLHPGRRRARVRGGAVSRLLVHTAGRGPIDCRSKPDAGPARVHGPRRDAFELQLLPARDARVDPARAGFPAASGNSDGRHFRATQTGRDEASALRPRLPLSITPPTRADSGATSNPRCTICTGSSRFWQAAHCA